MMPLTGTGSQRGKQNSEEKDNPLLSKHLAPCVVTSVYLSPPLDMSPQTEREQTVLHN